MKNSKLNLASVKQSLCRFLASLFFILPLILHAQTTENPFKIYWKNGFTFKSEDDQFSLKFGGRVQVDWLIFNDHDQTLNEAFNGLKNGTEFRRTRFFSQGKVYGNLHYKLQLDFSNGSAVFKDVYIGISDLPLVGNFRMGHFKEPLRLEVMSSSKYMTFIERAPGVSFLPERNMGFMFYNTAAHKHMTWAVGAFRRGDHQGNDKVANDEWNFTGRLTFLPYQNKEKRELLHIGIGGSYRLPQDSEYAIKSKPSSHLAPYLVNTSTLTGVNNMEVFNGEALYIAGPFSIQGEFITSLMSAMSPESAQKESIRLNSYYVYASYFLTGETRKYSTSSGAFSRIYPKKNFGHGGSGAWEVAVRYSNIDLNEKFVHGGKMNEYTVGLNWYLNPVSRMMFNYVYTDLVDIGKVQLLETRFMVDF